MTAIQTLFERVTEHQAVLPDDLRIQYAGDLGFPLPPDERPYLVANFVSTLDGVVSFDIPGKAGGGPISGANPGDRFIMGLLRASADAVLVGSGTVAAVSPKHLWVAGYINPQAAESYDRYRQVVVGKPPRPIVVIVSGTGRLDLSRAIFHAEDVRVLVVTNEAGCRTLTDAGIAALSSVVIRALPPEDGRLAPAAILRLLKQEFGVGLIVHEGGSASFGQFWADGYADELFLTLTLQVAGRAAAHFRPALIMGSEFLPETAPWIDLLTVKRGGDHLYLRYRVPGRTQGYESLKEIV